MSKPISQRVQGIATYSGLKPLPTELNVKPIACTARIRVKELDGDFFTAEWLHGNPCQAGTAIVDGRGRPVRAPLESVIDHLSKRFERRTRPFEWRLEDGTPAAAPAGAPQETSTAREEEAGR